MTEVKACKDCINIIPKASEDNWHYTPDGSGIAQCNPNEIYKCKRTEEEIEKFDSFNGRFYTQHKYLLCRDVNLDGKCQSFKQKT